MKRGLIIGAIIIIVVIIIAGISFLFYPQSEKEIINSNTNCTRAGQSPDEYSFGMYIGPIPQCCDGLKRINVRQYEDGECYVLPDTGTICSDCGNDICEEWENPCNCPDDCK